MKEALILVAHADDETLGAGGTIPKLIRDGWRVCVVILSDANRYGGHGQSNRPMIEPACEILGVSDLFVLEFPDQKFDTVSMAELSQKVLDLKLGPDLVISHADTDLNMDHRLTAEVARIVSRPREKPVSLLAAEIASTSFWNGRSFAANFYVDVTETINTKIKAFQQYVHEVKPYPHPWSVEGLKLLAKYHGMQSGVPYAEAFTLIRGYEGLLPGAPG